MRRSNLGSASLSTRRAMCRTIRVACALGSIYSGWFVARPDRAPPAPKSFASTPKSFAWRMRLSCGGNEHVVDIEAEAVHRAARERADVHLLSRIRRSERSGKGCASDGDAVE